MKLVKQIGKAEKQLYAFEVTADTTNNNDLFCIPVIFIEQSHFAFLNHAGPLDTLSAALSDNLEVLAIQPVSNQFLKHSRIYKIAAELQQKVELPELVAATSQTWHKSKRTILWKGTKIERRLILPMGVSLLRRRKDLKAAWPTNDDIVTKVAKAKDLDTPKTFSWNGVAIAPYFNHVLKFSLDEGRYFDPVIELKLGRKLHERYAPFINSVFPTNHF